MGKDVKDIFKLAIQVKSIVRNIRITYAHTGSKILKKLENSSYDAPELLEEHIDRCLYYFRQLYIQKNLKEIFNRFKSGLFGEMSLEEDKLFDEMLINILVLHDIGKINPAFQKIKMKNSQYEISDIACLDSTKHALFSSAIFIDYYSEQIKQRIGNKDEMERMHSIMLIDSYIISRHHVDLTAFSSYLDEFEEGGKLNCIFEGLMHNELAEVYYGPFYQGRPELINLQRKNVRCLEKFYQSQTDKLTLYTYIRLMFSLLVSCDYYATTEYENGMRICNFGNISDIKEMETVYEQSELVQEIRKFSFKEVEDNGKDINILRREMFLEAEKNLDENRGKNIYFIEAPTGGGKSNIAMNCSFKMLDDDIRKIFYVYPFNTLVEQNIESLYKIFKKSEIMQSIAVINSITPIKTATNEGMEDNTADEENTKFFQQSLLDRQFLNYPFILTTHVNLFQMMFGCDRSAAVSFYQLSGSVIVLDEIQSYRNTIWTEIMMFLENYSKLLNAKFVIMSATLPRLDVLTGNRENVVNLIQNSRRYFGDIRFKSRVKISYELMDENSKTDEEQLYCHICGQIQKGKKILVEFIKKKRAETFYRRMKEQKKKEIIVLCMTGDDNLIDRRQTLKQIMCQEPQMCVVLIATQVVEAGIDIDMDIGYKDISKLDSDEQFLGRINRNFKRSGRVYFFNMDDAGKIYGQDYRVNCGLTLSEPQMRTVLERKDFDFYYKNVLELLRMNWNEKMDEKGISYFCENEVGKLDFPAVAKRMRLIEENQWDLSVYLARIIIDDKGNMLDGMKIWEDYRELLANQTMEYARKQVMLSEIRSKMSYFIYRINKNSNLIYSDRIGELYCIENAEKYFDDGRLNKELFVSQGAIFVDI